MTPATFVTLFGAGFVASHVVMSHPPVRKPLVDTLGELPFRALYSVIALMFFGGMLLSWWPAHGTGAVLWTISPPVGVHFAELVIGGGLVLMLGGVAQPSPSSLTAPGAAGSPLGLHAITRHPVNLGVTLLALGHLIGTGTSVDVAFWGTLLQVGLLGGLHQDWRMKLEKEGYAEFAAQTRFLPVVTLGALRSLEGRAMGGMAAGLVAAIGLRLFHGQLFG